MSALRILVPVKRVIDFAVSPLPVSCTPRAELRREIPGTTATVDPQPVND